ncbi:MAG: YraN family protein [Firmicutes bacterium]|nr:YraN family protein [Bacillota bacterium]
MVTRRRKALGEKGELAAMNFLAGQGYRIVERNWRGRRGELDIIASDGGCLVFVEVRTRASPGFGEACESVGPQKRRRLIACAVEYIIMILDEGRRTGNGIPREYRFDVITVFYFSPGEPEIVHYKDAFGRK